MTHGRTVGPGRFSGTFDAPPSKSYTHRALVASFLTGRPTDILRPLACDDTRATARGLGALGGEVRHGPDRWRVLPRANDRRRRRTVRLGESGTTARLLVALSALGDRPVRFEAAGALARRPMGGLYAALTRLGARVRCERKGDAFPCEVVGPIGPGVVEVPIDESSQFLSALLLVLPRLSGRSELRWRGRPVSWPYVEATRATMRHFGVPVESGVRRFVIRGPLAYRPSPFPVTGDASSAAYLFAAAALSGGEVRVRGIDPRWPQADLALLGLLSRMGAFVERGRSGIVVRGPLARGAGIDLTDAPDLLPLVAVLAATVARGSSRVSGIARTRRKESDRVEAAVRLLRALGAAGERSGDRLLIRPGTVPRRVRIPPSRDHRVVMAASVAALGAPRALRLVHADAVRKSYPGFWTAFSRGVDPGGRSR